MAESATEGTSVWRGGGEIHRANNAGAARGNNPGTPLARRLAPHSAPPHQIRRPEKLLSHQLPELGTRKRTYFVPVIAAEIPHEAVGGGVFQDQTGVAGRAKDRPFLT